MVNEHVQILAHSLSVIVIIYLTLTGTAIGAFQERDCIKRRDQNGRKNIFQ